MDKSTLLKRLEALCDEAMRARLWGTIEITFQNGIPTMFRKISTEKLTHEGATHDRRIETRTASR